MIRSAVSEFGTALLFYVEQKSGLLRFCCVVDVFTQLPAQHRIKDFPQNTRNPITLSCKVNCADHTYILQISLTFNRESITDSSLWYNSTFRPAIFKNREIPVQPKSHML